MKETCMATEIFDRTSARAGTPCSHQASAPYIDVMRNRHNTTLRRHECGPCRCNWWESDGKLVGISDALRMITRAAGTPQTPLPQGKRPLGPGRLRRSDPGGAERPHAPMVP